MATCLAVCAHTRRDFRAFQTSLKLFFCVKHLQFGTNLFSFSVWIFEIESKALLDLLNTGLTITENGLFCVVNTGS